MAGYEIECRFRLPALPAVVFDFFADPGVLDRVTPPWLGFTVLTPMPVALGPGVTIDYRLRWRRVRLAWRSEITVWEPPAVFTYEQRRGPYRRWLHEHRYERSGGGTLVIDRAEWEVTCSRLVRPLVERDLVAIFTHRARVVARELGAGGAGVEIELRRLRR